MRRGVLFFVGLLGILALGAQKKYKMPKGISRANINAEWVVVKVKEDLALRKLTNERIPLKSTDKRPSEFLDGLYKIKVKPREDPIELINKLLQEKSIVYAEPILQDHLLYTPSDPNNTTSQSYLAQINAYEAWDITRGDDDITIGIIDTGLSLEHNDLSSSLWTNENDPIDGIDNDENGYVDDYYGYDFADEDNDPEADGSTHGAQVGGIAGASTDNGIGMSGVGFNTKIAALKGFRTEDTRSNNLFDAVLYAADNGIQVINLSWGSLRDPLQSEQDIINYAVLEKDVVVVAAAGNTDVDGKFYPASYDNILSVSAVGSDDERWSIATYNYSVDIMAPGVLIYSTTSNDEYKSDWGTSFSSPMVAGTAALVRAQFPSLTAQQVMERIRVTADDIYDVGNNALYESKLGLGRLNVYKAVSDASPKSLRITDSEISTSHSNQLFFGDTVTISMGLTNFLTRLDDPQITISSPDDQFSISNNTLFPGSMDELETSQNSLEIILNESLLPETPIDIRLDINDGTYNDFQFLETITSPDYFDFGDQLKMTIAGIGNLGFSDIAFSNGIGINLDDTKILDHAGIMIAYPSEDVTDNLISDYSTLARDQDFTRRTYFKLYNHPSADIFGYTEYEDVANDLIIEQSSYAWTDEDYLLFRYRIVNNSANPVDGISMGFYTDFDLAITSENSAAYDAGGDYLFTKDFSETLFAGTKIIANGTERYSALDMAAFNGNEADINDAFLDAIKHDFLVNQQLGNAGTNGNGNDVAMINGITFNEIPAFGEEFFNVIIAVGTTQAELENLFTTAESRLDQVVEAPRLIGTIYSCEGSQVTLDPNGNDTYAFYEDPAGSALLHEGTSFETGVIDQDSSFYVRNISGNYPSDIFQHRVILIEEVADFEMEPDTLYLDNATNVVSFTDLSQDPNVWRWDFGQGTTSSIQHPTLSFNEDGEYPVSLYVENINGCIDTKVKTLVVTERPDAPTFDPFVICPLESITLSDPTADYLNVYTNESDIQPEQQGNNFMIGPFPSDSTIYVSGVYNQFESSKAAVTIDAYEVEADFTIEIDTTTEAHQLLVKTNTEESIVEWTVNDESRGDESEINVSSTDETAVITLTVESDEGCLVTTQKRFEFTTSPIPSQKDLSFCIGESNILRPENGTIFGFYEDQELSRLIKKGTSLMVEDEAQVFVVGLDDGLPSTPIEVVITYKMSEVEIITEETLVGDRVRISFSTNPTDGLNGHEWYINGSLESTIASPILFFEEEPYEVILAANGENGCVARDTINLDFTRVVLSVEDQELAIYPNPSNGIIYTGKLDWDHVSLWNLSGKQLAKKIKIENGVLDLSYLSTGMYVLKLHQGDHATEHKIIIESD